MNNFYYTYPYPPYYYTNIPVFHHGYMYDPRYWELSNEINNVNPYGRYPNHDDSVNDRFNDQGKNPFVININQAAKQNNTFRTAIWTGDNLQVTLMSIDVGGDVGLEVHPDIDQFLRIEEDEGYVQMGPSKDELTFVRHVYDDSAIMVPAGTWHNITNTGNRPLKLYSIYAPPEHPFGTVHQTQAEAIAAEENDDHTS